MRKDQAPDQPVSGTGHKSADSPDHQAVSVTGHTKAKKKRDWKAINAKRATSVAGKTMGCSRYSIDQVCRLRRFAGDEFDERLKSGELTIAQAFKILKDRAMSTFDEDTRRIVKIDLAERKVRKYWTCMLGAARQAGIPEDRIRDWIAMVLEDE
jgi:hypothetical protein